MKGLLFSGMFLAILAGCGSEFGYRYQPHPQVLYSPIFADYHDQGKTVDILVDTDGLRLDKVSITKSDGSVVKPSGVDYPPFESQIKRGSQDQIYGPALAQGPTIAHFDKDAIGPGPWNVHVQIQDVPPETIRVGTK